MFQRSQMKLPLAPNNAPRLWYQSQPEDILSRSAIDAPIEALQGLANAAAEAASAPELSPGYVIVYIWGFQAISTTVGVTRRLKGLLAMRSLTSLKK